MGENILLSKNWTTHMPVLIELVQLTKKPVLELGAGLFSTPLLHWLCAESNRKLFTYEHYEKYFRFAKQFLSKNHRIRFVEDWEEADFDSVPDRYWSVALVDHEGKRRKTDTIRLKDKAEYIVLHDTSYSNYGYRFRKLWPKFKYVYHWKYCKPYTSVLSNFSNLDFLQK